MRTKLLRINILVWCSVVFFSCITVNIYFPEAAVQKAADDIVDEIRKNNKEDEKKEKKKTFPLIGMGAGFLLVPETLAQEETTVTTPKIRALKDSIRNRFDKLIPFFNEGRIGESNDGHVRVRSEDGLALQRKAVLRRLVKEENSDRNQLYLAVARALEIKPNQVNRVKRIFARSWIRKAQVGWWIQTPEDNWIKKPPPNQ